MLLTGILTLSLVPIRIGMSQISKRRQIPSVNWQLIGGDTSRIPFTHKMRFIADSRQFSGDTGHIDWDSSQLIGDYIGIHQVDVKGNTSRLERGTCWRAFVMNIMTVQLETHGGGEIVEIWCYHLRVVGIMKSVSIHVQGEQGKRKGGWEFMMSTQLYPTLFHPKSSTAYQEMGDTT